MSTAVDCFACRSGPTVASTQTPPEEVRMHAMFPALPFTGPLPALSPVLGSAALAMLVLAGLLLAAVLVLAYRRATPLRRRSAIGTSGRRRGVARGRNERLRSVGRVARLSIPTREVTP
jgi:hypothetical protein